MLFYWNVAAPSARRNERPHDVAIRSAFFFLILIVLDAANIAIGVASDSP